MTKLFITGATGYIGGDALHVFTKAHPEYEITAMVRNSDKGAKIAKQYPKVKLVYGDLDSVDVIEEESKKADIIFNFANADHAPAAEAIIRGLKAHPASSPGFLIHTSGTGILCFEQRRSGRFGEEFSTKIYDDLKDIGEVTSLPDDAAHRNVDKIVLAAGAEGLKTAIVCPPCIYGAGRGPDNTRSIQMPTLCRATLQMGHGIRVNQGKAYWSFVHVRDLSQLYLLLVEEAAAGGSKAEWEGKQPLWGAEGYYFCENGEYAWANVSRLVADEGHRAGLLKSNEVKPLPTEKIFEIHPYGPALWGANSRSRASRARELLKWTAKEKLEDDVLQCLETEAQALGLKTSHAAKAAGDA